jgi:hypothetical protein
MRTCAGHQFVGHVVDGNGVLVVCGVVVALMAGMEQSGYRDDESGYEENRRWLRD